MDAILSYEHTPDADFYQILGCDEQSTTEQILAEYRAQVLHCHPDKNPGDRLAVERFSRLQNAKETLSDPELRTKYDQWRHSGISMSYDQWRGLRDSVHMSMHWGTVKPKTMLADTSETVSQPPVQKSSPCHGQTTLHAHKDPSPSTVMPHLSPTTGQKPPPWERDPPSPLLEKFRNYQV